MLTFANLLLTFVSSSNVYIGGGAGGGADQRPVPGGQEEDGVRAADQAGPGRAVGPG